MKGLCYSCERTSGSGSGSGSGWYVPVDDLKFVPVECADERARLRREGRNEAAAVRLDRVVDQEVVLEAADELECSRWNG